MCTKRVRTFFVNVFYFTFGAVLQDNAHYFISQYTMSGCVRHYDCYSMTITIINFSSNRVWLLPGSSIFLMP